jgi:hypothetical protein
MAPEDKFRVAAEALRRIANFGHTYSEHCVPCAPVHECGCYEDSEQDIARKALQEIDDD